MIIQSSFTDYYDYVRKTGIDKTLTYKRVTTQLKENGREPYWHSKYVPRWDKEYIDISPLGVIEFCGDRYYFAKTENGVSYDKKDWGHLFEATKRKWHLHQDKQWFVPLNTYYKSDTPIIVLLTEKEFSIKKGILERVVAYENPKLADFSFGKVVSPEQAYQQLMMWFANKKLPPPIPHVDDKTMAEAKGFNKHSFRSSK